MKTPPPKPLVAMAIRVMRRITMATRSATHWIQRHTPALVAVLALAAQAAALPACDTPSINWPKVAKCGDVSSDLFDVVATVLISDGTLGEMTDRATAELEDLARQRGPAVVACVIDTLITEWTSPAASPDPVRYAAARRGRNFLEAKGVEPTPPPGRP